MRGVVPALEGTRLWRPAMAAILILTLFLALTPPSPVLSASYEVTNALDNGSAGTLRKAIMDANANPGADTITFDSSILPGVITLVQATGEIAISDDLTITGPGAAILTVSGDSSIRVFSIESNVLVEISDLTIANGHSSGGEYICGTEHGGDGGAILADSGSRLTLTDCVLESNATGNGSSASCLAFGGNGGNGGAVASFGTLTLRGCTLHNNQTGAGGSSDYIDGGSGGNGGAIYSEGALTLSGCTLENNHTGDGGHAATFQDAGNGGRGGNGGAIYSEGALALSGCTLEDNHTGEGGHAPSFREAGKGGNGGAIAGSGTLNLRSCAFQTNYTGEGGTTTDCYGFCGNGGNGGAIDYSGTLNLQSCTFHHNSTGNGSTSSSSRGGHGGQGGAIRADGQVAIESCAFHHNSTGVGGASFQLTGGYGGCGGAIFTTGALTLKGCSLYYNYTGQGGLAWDFVGGRGGHGGAIYSGAVTITSCEFDNNWTGTGGINGGASPETSGPGGNGGACYLYVSGETSIIRDSSFTSCRAGNGPDCSTATAGRGGNGGALHLKTGDFQMLDCTLDGNSAGNGGAYTGSNPDCVAGQGGEGGAVSALEGCSLVLRDCSATNNEAGDGGNQSAGFFGQHGGDGGGLSCYCDCLIESCLFAGNQAGDGGSNSSGSPGSMGGDGGYGGGLLCLSEETTILQTTVEDNSAGNGGIGARGGDGGCGGGLARVGALTMKDCTFSGNHSGTGGSPGPYDGRGGGITLLGHVLPSDTATLVNCTITDNYCPSNGMDAAGGGLFIADAVCHLSHCTISDNTATRGGGLMVLPFTGLTGAPEPGRGTESLVPTLLFKNCIVAGNHADAGPDISDEAWRDSQAAGGIVSHGCNLFRDDEGFSLVYASGAPDDIFGADPMLGALADNGGPTRTMALRSGSPAIDGVEEGRCRTVDGDSVGEDQRGEPRPMNGDLDGTVLCDIGAYEAPGPLVGVEEPEEERTPLPASMSTCYMALGAYQALPGQAVQVSVNLCNSGEVKGSQTVVLSVNGAAEQSQTVGVSGGSCKTVVFAVAKSVPGTYDIDVNGMHGQFTVLAPRLVQGSVPSQQDNGLGTAGIIAIVAVMVVLVLGLVVVFRQS